MPELVQHGGDEQVPVFVLRVGEHPVHHDVDVVLVRLPQGGDDLVVVAELKQLLDVEVSGARFN